LEDFIMDEYFYNLRNKLKQQSLANLGLDAAEEEEFDDLDWLWEFEVQDVDEYDYESEYGCEDWGA
jgi:hypothetical protein